MLSDKDWEALKNKIDTEYPIRKALAKMLDRKLIDETVRDLFVDILIYRPSLADQARDLIKGKCV